jgi:hypothetical protein
MKTNARVRNNYMACRETFDVKQGQVGFLMKNLDANALDYTESKYAERRRELSSILESTNPDLAEE